MPARPAPQHARYLPHLAPQLEPGADAPATTATHRTATHTHKPALGHAAAQCPAPLDSSGKPTPRLQAPHSPTHNLTPFPTRPLAAAPAACPRQGPQTPRQCQNCCVTAACQVRQHRRLPAVRRHAAAATQAPPAPPSSSCCCCSPRCLHSEVGAQLLDREAWHAPWLALCVLVAPLRGGVHHHGAAGRVHLQGERGQAVSRGQGRARGQQAVCRARGGEGAGGRCGRAVGTGGRGPGAGVQRADGPTGGT